MVLGERARSSRSGSTGPAAREGPRRLPATTVAISTAKRAASSPMTMPWKCLTVLLYAASISWSCDVRPMSWALTVGHMKPIDGR